MEIGKTYIVNHSRKGIFVGKLVSQKGNWALLVIQEGKAKAKNQDNEREQGEEVAVNISLCTLTKK